MTPTTNTLTRRTLLASLVFLLAALPLTAREPAGEVKKEQPYRYQVYSWNCSRSLKKVLATNDLEEAFEAAQQARATHRNVRVVTGLQDPGLGVIFDKPVRYEVYRKRWSRATTFHLIDNPDPELIKKALEQDKEPIDSRDLFAVAVYQ
jgi:hypothetical protein